MSVIIFVLHTLFFPQLSGWELLSDVEIVKGYDEYLGAEVDKPSFSENLISQNGKELVLVGYIIPLEQNGNQDYFILSRFPYQSCFFCGAAGPETVVEVFSDKGIQYTEDRIQVKGILRLNKDNPMQLFYTLKDCTVEIAD